MLRPRVNIQNYAVPVFIRRRDGDLFIGEALLSERGSGMRLNSVIEFFPNGIENWSH
jgi:hypothetical protein